MFDHQHHSERGAWKRRAVAGFAAVAAFLVPIVAAAADLTGGWVVHAEWTPKFKYDLLCGLTQQEQTLAGPCMALGAPPEKAGGTLDKNKLELEYLTVFEGSDVGVHMHGNLDANGAVKGQVESGASQGEFSGVPLGSAGLLNDWKLHVRIAQFDLQMLCVLKLNGRSVRGPCAVGDGVVLRTAGTADDKSVTFAYDTNLAGTPLHVTYTGALQPDGSIKGSASDGTNNGVFTAKRR